MYLDDESSAFNIFSTVCRYIGSSSRPHWEIKGRYGLKRLYISGFSNRSQWKKILGLNLSGITIEELSIADPDFIRESFVRATRLDNDVWILGSTNGSHPDDIFYREFWDKSYVNPEYNKNIPEITLAYMNETEEKDDDFEYVYLGFRDVPIQSEATIDRLANIFPVGSFFYMSKYIGARGFLTGSVYAEVMSRERHMITHEEAMKKHYIRFAIGVDVGFEDHTVFTLVGFTTNFRECIVIDSCEINHAGADEIYKTFSEWYQPYHTLRFSNRMEGVFFDPNPGKILRTTLKNKFLNDYNILTGDAIKKKIIHRIEANLKLLSSDRLLFTDRTENIYKAFTSVTYTKDKSKTDPRVFGQHINKDRVDSTEYGQAKFIEVMLRRT